MTFRCSSKWKRFEGSGLTDSRVLFRQDPHLMAMFAVTLVFNETEDDPQMQDHGRHDEFSRHLRIVDLQRTARRAMQRLVQNRWRRRPQEFAHVGKKPFSHLNLM